ncbi:hypothetical protein [Adhaeretor mobilis]|uniref:Alginate export domain-containing protein n=1 Tax=Adhaeretor mobilis TaxID=1930276 RepID=A0A517N383_9BACT|nr:hypothetical protein [Adhaeretor mobilis]QDT01602.1 hypothetical protein HG15A2_49490 [Adhaeretor mobilis]
MTRKTRKKALPGLLWSILALSPWLQAVLLVSSSAAQEAILGKPPLDAGPVSSIAVRTDTELFRYMLDFQNRQNSKEVALLLNHDTWGDDQLTVTLGGQARFSLLAATTNTADKFSYLGRFPTDFSGDSATDARVLQANTAMTVHAGSWVNFYGELLFSDVFSFADFKQGSLQTRQAYAVFGDLDVTPWYAFVGKKNLSFGDMSTLSPFTQAVPWHYFGALGEGIGAGYAGEKLHVAVQAVNGSRGIRVADSEEKGKLNNVAANAIYTIDIAESSRLQLGSSFLLGTIYDGNVAEHLDPAVSGETNSAYDINALLQVGQWSFAGEFVSTVDDWPVTNHPVRAYKTEAAYDTCLFETPSRLSVSWSEGIQGDEGTEFEFNNQLVLGLGMQVSPHALLTAEYVRSIGFAPLLGITTVSDRDVVQNSAVFGATLVF